MKKKTRNDQILLNVYQRKHNQMCNRSKGLHCVTDLQSGAEHTIDTRQTAHIVMSSVDSDVRLSHARNHSGSANIQGILLLRDIKIEPQKMLSMFFCFCLTNLLAMAFVC